MLLALSAFCQIARVPWVQTKLSDSKVPRSRGGESSSSPIYKATSNCTFGARRTDGHIEMSVECTQDECLPDQLLNVLIENVNLSAC
jgi:hypothetical protein